MGKVLEGFDLILKDYPPPVVGGGRVEVFTALSLLKAARATYLKDSVDRKSVV